MAFAKRTVFLINPNFQLRISLLVAGVIFVSSFLYPLVFLDFMNDIVEVHPEITASMLEARSSLLIFLIPLQLILSLLVFVFCIFLTHRIAGPMYKLKDHLSAIGQGEAFSPLTFRKGDHFQDVAEEVSLFLDVIEDNQARDFQYLDEVAAYVENLSGLIPEDKRPVLNEISRKLQEIKSRYKKEV